MDIALSLSTVRLFMMDHSRSMRLSATSSPRFLESKTTRGYSTYAAHWHKGGDNMSSPIQAVLTGSFTSAGAVINLPLPSGYDTFEMINITDIGSTAANTNVMRAQGTSLMLAGSAYFNPKTSGAAT